MLPPAPCTLHCNYYLEKFFIICHNIRKLAAEKIYCICYMRFLSFLKNIKAGLIGLTIALMIVLSAVITSMDVFAMPAEKSDTETELTEEHAEKQEIDAGKMIIEHLVDAHE